MGEAWSAEGARVGYLEQEPKLDENKTVQENGAQLQQERNHQSDTYKKSNCTNDIEDTVPDTSEMNTSIEKLEFGAVQKCINLVEREKCCKMTVHRPKSVSIQKRTVSFIFLI